MADVTLANSWVESYLSALVARGLSSEHLGSSSDTQPGITRAGSREEDASSITARYYVHQILSLDEDHIRDAWAKASRPSRSGAYQAERDARMEHLSWRVWSMKRRRAEVEAALAADKREAAAELLREGAEDEEEDEVDATTLRTIDELNSTAMAAFEECGLASRAFGSVAIEALPEELEDMVGQVDEMPAQEPVADAPDGAWVGVKEYSSAAAGTGGASVATPDLPNLVHPSRSKPTATTTLTTSSGGHYASPFATSGLNAAAAAGATGQRTPPAAGSTLTAPATPVAASTVTNASGLQAQQPSVAAAGAGAAPDPLLVSRFPRLYVILISLHGLVRGEKMELGKDPDTGGQVKYVVELAKAMAQFPSVARVDLLTRLIADPKVDKSYSEPEERLILPPLPPAAAAVAAHYGGGTDAASAAAGDMLGDVSSPKSSNSVAEAAPSSSPKGAFIVRLPCGDPKVYLRKEDLWSHIREFSDRAIAHAQATLARLQETGEGPCELYVVHGHYADAGEVAAMVASSLGVDCVLTGHSLGRNKKEHLLKSGTMSMAEVEATYKIGRRIEAEERALDAASVVFTSTHQEVADQWGHYDGYSDELSAALQLRPCKGYHVPRMAVIPPGLDFSNLKVSMPSDPWDEVLGSCPIPTAPPLSPAGPSGMPHSPSAASLRTLAAPNVPTPPLSPRNSNLPLSPHRLSPHNSTVQPVVVPAAGASDAASPASPAPTLAASAGVPPTPGSAGPLTPNSLASATQLNSSGGASPVPLSPQTSNPPSVVATITAVSGEDKAAGEKVGLKINIPKLSAAADPNASHPAAEAPAAAAPADGSSPAPLVKRGSFLGVVSPTERSRAHKEGGLAAPSEAGTGLVSMNSKRTGVTDGGRHSVAATPRSPTPYGGVAMNPGKMNPRVLAAMMVGESEPGIWKEINRFLRFPGRPVILAMSRPDAKKNILALVRAYGQSRVLRDLANLVLIMGNREVIDGMAPGSQRVLNDVLKLVDAYDLYGHVAYPKKHAQSDISDIYLLAAATRGVFVNIALQEPFGLTLIEAAAHGAPIVATQNGGPVDIIGTLKNGVLVEPTDVSAIAEACVSLITSQRTWEEYSDNGRKNITYYSWPSHCARYLRTVQDQKALLQNNTGRTSRMYGPMGHQDPMSQKPGAIPPAARFRHTLSLSYDDLSILARAIATSTNTASANVISDAVAIATATADAAKQPADAAAAADAKSADTSADAAPKQPVPAPAAKSPVPEAQQDGASAMPRPASAALSLRAGSMPPGVAISMMSALARPRRDTSRGLKISTTGALLEEAASTAAAAAAKGDVVPAAASGTAKPSAFAETAAMDAVTEGEHEGEAASPPAPTPGSLSKAPSGVPPLSTHPAYLQPRLTQHERFVVFNLDTLADVRVAAPVIRALVGGGMQAEGGWNEQELAACVGMLAAGPTGAASAGGLGVGVMCTWSNKDMRALLAKEGISPLSLDFMVCNAGALIWHAMASDNPSGPSSPKHLPPAGASQDLNPTNNSSSSNATDAAVADAPAGPEGETRTPSGKLLTRRGSMGLSLFGFGGKSAAGEGAEGVAEAEGSVAVKEGSSWMSDDQWEQHVDFRWDERVVLQVLSRILDNKTGWGKLHIVRPNAAASKASAPQPAGTTAVTLRLSPKCTPYHYMVDVDVGGAVGGRTPLPPAEVANQLLAAVRRKLRMCGLRAQVTVTPREPLPTTGDVPSRSKRNMLTAIAGNILSSLQSLGRSPSSTGLNDASSPASPNSLTLHITPLRCSRPLALRHLATKFRRPMDVAWSVVACTNSAPAAATTPDGSSTTTVVPSNSMALLSTTDGEELVGGVQQVVLLPVKKDQAGLGFPVDVSVFGAAAVKAADLAATPGTKPAARVVVLETSS